MQTVFVFKRLCLQPLKPGRRVLKLGLHVFLLAIFIKLFRLPFWFKFSVKGVCLSSFDPPPTPCTSLVGDLGDVSPQPLLT